MIILIFLLLFSSCNAAKQALKDNDPLVKLISNHSFQQERRYGLNLVAIGNIENKGIDRFSLQFIAYKKLKVPSVRRLIVLSIEEFLDKVNCDCEVRSRLGHHPITIDDISFNVGFAEHDGAFMEPPYIAYAYFREGQISYCYYDNLFGKFTEHDDIEEPYHVAKRMVLQE